MARAMGPRVPREGNGQAGILSFKNEHTMRTDTCQKKNESLGTRHQAFGRGEGEQRNVHECEEGESKQTPSTQSRNKTTSTKRPRKHRARGRYAGVARVTSVLDAWGRKYRLQTFCLRNSNVSHLTSKAVGVRDRSKRILRRKKKYGC